MQDHRIIYFIGIMAFVAILVGICGLCYYTVTIAKVKKNSSKYQWIMCVNELYYFNYSIKTCYTYDYTCKDKRKYDYFNSDDYMFNLIFQDIDYFKSLIEKIEYNQNTMNAYIREIDRVSLSKSGSFLYLKIENKLCREAKLKAPLDVEAILKVMYTSPKGQNSYIKKYTYHFDNIVFLYRKINKRKEYENSKNYQRSLMTNKLRYQIMQRDNFRCQLCGRTASDGVILHVDHIFPVSKGGKTVPENLRTLCDQCNSGKGKSFDFNKDN